MKKTLSLTMTVLMLVMAFTFIASAASIFDFSDINEVAKWAPKSTGMQIDTSTGKMPQLIDEDGTVYQARIDKPHIYAYFDGRNESEVIVDPKYLMDITESESMDNSFDITM